MSNRRCIYTVFYNKLANYDGRDSRSEYRHNFLERCVRSYKLNNPNTEVIVEMVDEPVANTADMYFDKMRRIKEMNYLYDVLWVDGDTLCLQNIEHIFDCTSMCSVTWYEYMPLNIINGGIVYYPKRYLYDNWDWFVTQWINLLSGLHIDGDVIFEERKFNSIMEQIPITNLLLKNLGESINYKNYDFGINKQSLMELGLLLDFEYNYNPILMHLRYDKTYHRNKFTGGLGGHSTIAKKKIIHLNSSLELKSFFYNNTSGCFISNNIDFCAICDYILENFIGIIDDVDMLTNRCKQLRISNSDLDIDVNSTSINIKNSTMGFYKCYMISETNSDYHVSFGVVPPGWNLADAWVNHDANGVMIKNLYSGEETIINRPVN